MFPLPLLKSALHLLIEQLRDFDRVALVVYAGNAGLVLDSTSGREKTLLPTHSTAWKREGSTAGGDGIPLAYALGNDRIHGMALFWRKWIEMD